MAAPSFAGSRATRLRPRLRRDPAAPARIRILHSAAPRIRQPPSLPRRSARPLASLCSIRAVDGAVRRGGGGYRASPAPGPTAPDAAASPARRAPAAWPAFGEVGVVVPKTNPVEANFLTREEMEIWVPAVVHCLHATVDGEEQGFMRNGDPNKFDSRVFTPLVSSLLGGSVECMKLLIEGGANVHAHGFSGATPLLLACSRHGNIGFVKCLFKAGADPNVPDEAKIDELKARTDYYSTQQLMQRYDLDPAQARPHRYH